jgi:hypothetical protein
VPEQFGPAVARLYEAFSRYPLRSTTSPCLHCHSPEEETALRERPLQELGVEALRGFAADAMMTWGDVLDFKHFLPRIFEIVATSDFNWPDLPVVFAHLTRGEWRTWPESERGACEAYLMAKWQATLSEFPAVHDADEVLCALGQCSEDLAPYLQSWGMVEGEPPVRHLAAFLWDNGQSLIEGRGLRNAFWSGDRSPQQLQVREWLRDPRLTERVEQTFFKASSPEVESELSTALTLLEALRR